MSSTKLPCEKVQMAHTILLLSEQNFSIFWKMGSMDGDRLQEP